MQLTTEQRVFAVQIYLERRSFVAVREAFRERFPDRNLPAKSTIQRNVEKYLREGTSLNLNKGRSGRIRTTRTQENINQVRELLQEQPRVISCRRNPIGLPKTSFNEITTKDLKWHPYKIHIVQKLERDDPARRMRFCRWFSEQAHNVRFLSNLVIGDEAIFQLNGSVSTQNVRCYAPKGEPPVDYKFEKSNSREKLHVWIGLCGNGQIIGPHFFNRNVNGRVYREMLEQVVFPAVAHIYQRYGDNFNDLWWFQDGAPAHRSRDVRRVLQERFEHRIVALNHDIEWPPRSPDLTPLDFFLWGYLKQKVFSTPPQDLPTLRRRIVDEVNQLRENEGTIRRSFGAMVNRADRCVQKNGSHVECF